MRKLNRTKMKFLAVYAAGVLSAVALFAALTSVNEAQADQYSCIRSAITARGMTGNIPDQEFTITYMIPACYGNKGYYVERVFMRGDELAVKYKR